MIPGNILDDIKRAFETHQTDEARVKMLFELWWSTSGVDADLQYYMVGALQLQRQELRQANEWP